MGSVGGSSAPTGIAVPFDLAGSLELFLRLHELVKDALRRADH